MRKKSLALLILSAGAGFALAGLAYAQNVTNIAGTYACGPDAKACEWSGARFTVTQTGQDIEAKNEKGDIGQGKVTSNISISMGPPWNMLGTIVQGNTIDWSNGTQWKKQ